MRTVLSALKTGAFLSLFLLVGCSSLISDLADDFGVPMAQSGGFYELPIGRWLTSDSVKPIKISFCRKPQCSSEVAVLVVELTGQDAKEARRILANPSQIGAVMTKRNAERMKQSEKSRKDSYLPKVKTTVQQQPDGFSLLLESEAKAAYARIVAQTKGTTLRLIIAIAESVEAAEQGALRP